MSSIKILMHEDTARRVTHPIIAFDADKDLRDDMEVRKRIADAIKESRVMDDYTIDVGFDEVAKIVAHFNVQLGIHNLYFVDVPYAPTNK